MSFSSYSNPSVTIAIPTLNEENYIEMVLQQFQKNTYPNIQSIYVVDGGSIDKTCEIVQRWAIDDSRIRLIHNHRKIQSAGLNLALEQCTTDLFLRADAHASYAKDYVESCVKAILESGATNVGGAQRFDFKNEFQKAVSILAQNPFGNGFAKYRNPNYSGFVDTVYLGCFKVKEIKSIGGYVDYLPINEDFDLNTRIRQTFGEQSVFLSSSIRVYYYPRDSFNRFVLQYFKYGLYKHLTSKMNKQYSIRSVLPVILVVLSLPISLTLSAVLPLSILFTSFLSGFIIIWLSLLYSANRKLDNRSFIQRLKLLRPCTLSLILIIAQQVSFSSGYLTSLMISFGAQRNY